MTTRFTNRLGLTIELVELGTVATNVTVDGKTVRMDTPIRVLADGLRDWIERGNYLQEALRFLSADEREFLLTGTTPDEWAAMFPDEGDMGDTDR